jgi:THO complex subunit 4
MDYDRSGRSNGSAAVHFAGRTDAIAAAERFHNVPLDGLPMRITLIDLPRRPVGPRAEASERHERWGHDMYDGAAARKDSRAARADRVDAEMLDHDLDAYMMQKH